MCVRVCVCVCVVRSLPSCFGMWSQLQRSFNLRLVCMLFGTLQPPSVQQVILPVAKDRNCLQFSIHFLRLAQARTDVHLALFKHFRLQAVFNRAFTPTATLKSPINVTCSSVGCGKIVDASTGRIRKRPQRGSRCEA